MKQVKFHKYLIALVGAAGLMASTAGAQTKNYLVTIDTSGLGANDAGAPFSLELGLTDGGVLNNNTVTLTNFTWGGGSAGSAGTLVDYGPSGSSAGHSGNLSSSVVLNDSVAYTDFAQSFNAGSQITFDLSLTENNDITEQNTNDEFVLGVDDASTYPIANTGLGGYQLAVTLGPTPQIDVGTDTSGDHITVSVAPVPEPSTWSVAAGGLALLIALRRRKSA